MPADSVCDGGVQVCESESSTYFAWYDYIFWFRFYPSISHSHTLFTYMTKQSKLLGVASIFEMTLKMRTINTSISLLCAMPENSGHTLSQPIKWCHIIANRLSRREPDSRLKQMRNPNKNVSPVTEECSLFTLFKHTHCHWLEVLGVAQYIVRGWSRAILGSRGWFTRCRDFSSKLAGQMVTCLSLGHSL